MAVFQILLAMGSPLGHAAFGGTHAVLPIRLRAASVISALLFVAAFYVVLARAGVIGLERESPPVRISIWVFTAILGISTLANANVASRSRWERFLMAPAGLGLTLCCLAVALGA